MPTNVLTVEPTRITVTQFLAFEDLVRRLAQDVRMMKDVSVNHGDMIRELMNVTSSTVSKAELMAAITTTRYQQLRLNITAPAQDGEDEDGDVTSVQSIKAMSTL